MIFHMHKYYWHYYYFCPLSQTTPNRCIIFLSFFFLFHLGFELFHTTSDNELILKMIR